MGFMSARKVTGWFAGTTIIQGSCSNASMAHADTGTTSSVSLTGEWRCMTVEAHRWGVSRSGIAGAGGPGQQLRQQHVGFPLLRHGRRQQLHDTCERSTGLRGTGHVCAQDCHHQAVCVTLVQKVMPMCHVGTIVSCDPATLFRQGREEVIAAALGQ
jgi:hypothetical protein